MPQSNILKFAYLLSILSLFVSTCLGNLYSHRKYKHSRGSQLLARRYLVELSNSPSLTNAFINYINGHSENVHVHRTIAHKFLNALTIEIKETTQEKEHSILQNILDHIDVESVSPIQIIERKLTPFAGVSPKQNNLTAAEVSLASPHRLSQIDRVHRDLNLTGEGMFVGVIDSGIDYNHPALGGGFGPGFKVIAGYDLVGDHYNVSDPTSLPAPDNDPLDNCGEKSGANGHGTHVSGIIAGYDPTNNFTGVAPNAKLGMWRVMSCNGSTTNDIALQALTMAYDAGVHIISMSLGNEAPWSAPNYVANKLISRITASGVHVIVAAGNSGVKGAYTTGNPSNAASAFSVASVENEYSYTDCLISASGVSNPIECNFGFDDDDTKHSNIINSTATIVYDEGVDACTPDSVPKNAKGSVVLVQYPDNCTTSDQGLHVQAAGAIGVIVYDNILEYLFYPNATNVTIPQVSVTLRDGNALIEVIKRNNVVSMKFATGRPLYFLNNPLATTTSYFSSVGPTADLSFKPNIAAIGQGVYSTVPSYLGNWQFKQGTSMACPYVSGSVALYLQQHGVNKTLTSTIEEKFQNYAFQSHAGNSSSGYLDNPLRVGAGLVQVYDTIVQTSYVSPGQLSFNDTSSTDYRVQNLTITNGGTTDVSYRIYNNVTIAVSPYYRAKYGYSLLQPSFNTLDHADIVFSAIEVHLQPGQSQVVTVTVNPPKIDPLDHIMYGGYVQFDPIASNAKSLHVPYFGVVGNQHDLPIFDRDYNITVAIATSDDVFSINNTFTFDFTTSPLSELKSNESISLIRVNYRLISPSLVQKVEVFSDQETKNLLGYIEAPTVYSNRDYLRKSTISSWDGQYVKTIDYDIFSNSEEAVNSGFAATKYVSVGSGQYFLRFSALKLFGDQSIETDWESFTVGPIVITR